MSANPKQRRRRRPARAPGPSEPTVVVPVKPEKIREVLDPKSSFLPPFRPLGSCSSSTACFTSNSGTLIDMTGLNQIVDIDVDDASVTVDAGMRIGDLAKELAAVGFELAGSHDLASRTVGGAVAGVSLGPAFGTDGGLFSSRVRSLRVVRPNGKAIEIRHDQHNLLNAFRLSYGMLGVIYEVTLNIHPIQTFAVQHRRCTFEQFGAFAEALSGIDVGLKCYLLPFRDLIYLDVRRYNRDAGKARRLPWILKEWGESIALPTLSKSLNRLVPVAGVRDRLVDKISEVTHGLVNNRHVATGSNSTAQPTNVRDNRTAGGLYYSTWFFPAAEFAVVVHAYRDFCQRTLDQTGYRCDLPTVCLRVGRDPSALLSPAFDEPMIALRAVSTRPSGWENFAIDFGEFARHWGGIPSFNQTRDVPAGYPRQVFDTRLSFFKKIRKQVDPEDRMMNVFLSQYFL